MFLFAFAFGIAVGILLTSICFSETGYIDRYKETDNDR